MQTLLSTQPFSPVPLASAPSVTAPASLGLQLRDKHFPYLAKGINIPGWFTESDLLYPSREHFEQYMTENDFRQIKAMGFSHIRLPIDPALIFDRLHPQKINPQRLDILVDSVKKATERGLAVVVDMHPYNEEFKRSLATNDAFVNDFAQFWNTVATRLSRVEPDKLFFETLNEPNFHKYTFGDATLRWEQVQDQLVHAIRAGAPTNTIIVKGQAKGGTEGSDALTLPKDENTIYSVHYYTPIQFTHQGAGFVDENYGNLHNMPYPENDAVLDQRLRFLTPGAMNLALQYRGSHIDGAHIERDFQKAIDWSKQNNVKLYLGEFGVLKTSVDPADRAHWISDLRTMCEKNGMGWSMWEYHQSFGLMNQQGSQRMADPNILEALGLPVSKRA